MGVWTPGPAATSGNDTFTGDGTGETADGLEGDDILNGNGGDDTLHDSAGLDVLNGGDGNDTLIATVDGFALYEEYHGGADFDTIRLTGAIAPGYGFNFNSFAVTGIEAIEFAADAANTQLTLYTTLIGNGVATDLLVTGNSSSYDNLNFQSYISGNYSLAGLQFVNWEEYDVVFLVGWYEDDVLTGSSVADRIISLDGNDSISGGLGNDLLFGGAGVDISRYTGISSGAASWHRNPDGTWTVTAGAQGTDALTSIEYLDFDDRDVFLDRAYSTFSGDGTSDVFMRHSSGALGMWFVDGSGVTGAASPGSIDPIWAIEGVGDFNGDGRDDIFMRHTSTGDLGTWFMDGGSATGATTFGNIDMSWGIEAIGDLNGDGSDDIVMWHSSGSLGVWFTNNGAISGAAGMGTISQITWDFEGLGDFNGDGRDDILWRNDLGNLGMWLMDGGAATGVGAGDISSSWDIEGVGDFDGDGRDDILMRDVAGNVGVWFMNGGSAVGAAGLGNVGTAFEVAAIGDFNGDGKDDILWWHDTGALGVWFMNGSTATATSYGSVSSDWVINPGG